MHQVIKTFKEQFKKLVKILPIGNFHVHFIPIIFTKSFRLYGFIFDIERRKLETAEEKYNVS
jgi:hypothetical protein